MLAAMAAPAGAAPVSLGTFRIGDTITITGACKQDCIDTFEFKIKGQNGDKRALSVDARTFPELSGPFDGFTAFLFAPGGEAIEFVPTRRDPLLFLADIVLERGNGPYKIDAQVFYADGEDRRAFYSGDFTVTPIPAALPLLGTALAGFGALAFRRRRQGKIGMSLGMGGGTAMPACR